MKHLTLWKYHILACSVAFCIGFFNLPVSASVIKGSGTQTSASGIDPVIFSFNCIDGQPGDTVCIPVTVQNFNDILIAQFEIIWNSDVLDYIRIQNAAPIGISINGDFNLSGPNALKFIPLGFDPDNGETLPDGATIFEVCFRIIGVPGATSHIGISPYFDFEVADLSGVIPSDSVGCVMTVEPAVNLVGFITSCGPTIAGNDGSIDLTVYGGTEPYTITWEETTTSVTGGPLVIANEGGNLIINVPTGNYDITITDAGGGVVIYNYNVADLGLSVTTRLRHPTCYKFENGTMWIKPAGGTAPFSFIWHSLTDPSFAGSGFIRDPGDSSLVTSLPDGMYHILVEDDYGCEAEITSVLNDNPFIITVDDMQGATCMGSEDGFISLTVSGATPDVDGNYTITIKQGFVVTTNTVTVGLLNPGDYCITIQDEVSQCDTVYCFNIASTTTISANVTTTDPTCAGGTDGRVSLRGLTNGTPGPSYSYTILDANDMIETTASNIGGIFNYSPLAPGDYKVIVSEGPCISDTIFFTISDPLPITVSVAGKSPDNCLPSGSGDIWFVINNGTGPYMLETSMGFQDGDTLFNLNAGNYMLTVTDVNGCTATLPFSIQDGDDNEETDISFQINGIPCEEGSTITVLYQGGSIPAGAGVLWSTGETSATITLEDINQYPETLSVDIILGAPIFCILDDTAIINCQKDLELDITVIQPLCNDEALGGPYTGSVVVDTSNATAPVTWIWSFGDTTQSPLYAGLSPGKYYVTVSDALDSIAVDSFEIIAPPPIHLSFGIPDSTSCPLLCDGFVQITPTDGTPGLDYFLYWTNGSAMADTGVLFNVADLCAGNTTFTVSQDGICFFTDSIEILAPDPVDINLVAAIDVTCFGDDDGSLEVTATGGTPGYTYNWQGGASSALNTNLSIGEYVVTVTDINGCIAIDSFVVNEPAELIATIDSLATINITCGNNADGVITVSVTGGNPGGYAFQWNPAVSTSIQAGNLTAGNYQVTVTDPKGCSDTASYTLTAPPPVVVTWPDVAPPLCFGDETVLLIDDVQGGSGNYTFTINSGQSFNLGDPVTIPAGIYFVTVSDDSGCFADTMYTIMEPNPVLVSISPDDAVIDLGDSLFIMGHIDQSDLPIVMMNWTSTEQLSCTTCEGTWVYNVLPATYTWTVTDVNGCQGSSSITVQVDFDRDVFVPNAFSPNNDGRNDDFMIFSGPGVEMINYVHIYDRWGNLVFSSGQQLPDPSGVAVWDGTSHGSKLNPGVYVYVAEVTFIDQHTTLVFRGDVTLLR